MWGNRLGWGISGAIVLFFLFVIYLIIAAGQASEPTKFINANTMATIKVPLNAVDVVPSMTDTADSEEQYRLAIADYKQHPTAYDTIIKKRKYAASDLKLPGVKALLDARKSTKATIFGANLDDLINYDNEKDDLEALLKVASTVKMIGLLRNADKEKDASDYFEAVFSLGYKLYEERLRFDELSRGDGLMGDGLTMLIQIADKAGNKTRAQALKQANADKINYYKNSIEPINAVISSIDPTTVAVHPGDVMKLAMDSPERMWRIEAVMKLGRQRYYSERKGDQLAANRVVKQLAKSETDPAVKTAAKAARDLTIEKYRMLQ